MHERGGIDDRRDAVDRVHGRCSCIVLRAACRVRASLNRATRARCGTSASTATPRPSRRDATTSARVRNTRSGCGIRIVKRPSARGEAGDALRRAVRVVRIGLGRAAAIVDEAQRDERLRGRELRAHRGTPRSLRRAPSRSACGCPPCRRRTATASAAPRPARSAPRTARTGCARSAASARRPGSSSRRLLIIWQPLQTPSAKVSPRAKNAANSSRARALNRIDFAQPSPAPSTSP